MTPIHLTEEQRQFVDAQQGRPADVVDLVANRAYVLVDREQFALVQQLLEEPRQTPPAAGISPAIRLSQEAYWRDLPALLKMKKSSKRQWVAYRGQQRIGFASTDAELYQECERRGIPAGEFYVDRVEPRVLPPWEEEQLEVWFESEQPPAPSAS